MMRLYAVSVVAVLAATLTGSLALRQQQQPPESSRRPPQAAITITTEAATTKNNNKYNNNKNNNNINKHRMRTRSKTAEAIWSHRQPCHRRRSHPL